VRKLALALLAAAVVCLVPSPAAAAEFGLSDFEVSFTDSKGAPAIQAGSHPYAMSTVFHVNTEEVEGSPVPAEPIKGLDITQVPGLAGDQTAVPPCPTLEFLSLRGDSDNVPECADGSAIGVITAEIGAKGGIAALPGPLYFLDPSPGRVAKLGFWVQRVPVTIDISASESFPYNLVASATMISQALEFYGAELTLWGVPADPAHDDERGACFDGKASCKAGVIPRPLLTMPRACAGPLATTYALASWPDPDDWVTDSVPASQGMSGCGVLGFSPQPSVELSSQSAESSTGIDFALEVIDDGLKNPKGNASADIKKIVTTFPEGMTVNPSAADGLGVCSRARYNAERLGVTPGEGCPEASKLGTIEAVTPLLENHPLHGAVYLAAQDDPVTVEPGAENPFDSLIALYLVIRDPELGIFVKLAGKVEPAPGSGQLVTTFDDLPQFPLSHVSLQMRPGPRAPLVTPPGCGTYAVKAILTPSSGAPPLPTTSLFSISTGVRGEACPSGPIRPFSPGFEAGSVNNAAGSFSPFYMRLTRRDGDQNMTRVSAILPPGVTGKIAGVAKCADAAIAAASSKSGRQEQTSPSCPPSSRVGRILAGAGVGSALTYVPGQIYLAGPYKGAPLSVAVITPAVAGPFDVGTVVVRVGLTPNPRTAEVEIAGTASDSIPHILKGIPLKLRDLRVYADRENFTLNPTSCKPSAARATLFGSFADPFNPADDVAIPLSSRYQAASCASLGFKPRLSLKLKGGTERGAFPSMRAELRTRSGDANIGKAVVTLPHSAFLAQEHIRTICTRVQFAANKCPKGSIYGRARAFTPLLDEPLEGPVYLRSSSNPLPDLIVALRGTVDIDLVGRVDSIDASLRTNFDATPDTPVTKFVLNMMGGKKGLVVNSRNLCRRESRATAAFTGQNGRRHKFNPVVRTDCAKGQRPGRGR